MILIVIILPSPLPKIVSIALPPRYITVVRLTKTNRLIQKIANIVFKLLLNRFFTNSGILKAIGKNSKPPTEDNCIIGEFIGLFMLSPQGIDKFLNVFDKINKSLTAKSPFENAAEWQKSYITDIMQYMVSNQVLIDCVSIEGGWKEFDTEQDFKGGLPLWKN